MDRTRRSAEHRKHLHAQRDLRCRVGRCVASAAPLALLGLRLQQVRAPDHRAPVRATRGDYTQVAPTYDVSGKAGRPRAPTADPVADVGQRPLPGRAAFAQAQARPQRALKADPRSGDAHTLLGVIADAARRQHGWPAATTARRSEIAPEQRRLRQQLRRTGCAPTVAPRNRWRGSTTRIADPPIRRAASALANAGTCAQQAGQTGSGRGELAAGAGA